MVAEERGSGGAMWLLKSLLKSYMVVEEQSGCKGNCGFGGGLWLWKRTMVVEEHCGCGGAKWLWRRNVAPVI